MQLEDFKKELHAIFEGCDYTQQLSEEEKKVPFTYTSPEGIAYQIEVEPEENEFYVYQDGKQIDLFNTALLDKDGGVPKQVRQAIAMEWQSQQNGKAPEPISTDTPEEPVPQDTGAPLPTQGVEQPVAEADVNKQPVLGLEIGDEFHNKIVKHKNTGKIGKVASNGSLRHTKGSNTAQVWWKNADGSWDKNPEMDVHKALLDIQPDNALTEQQLNEVAEIIKKSQN